MTKEGNPGATTLATPSDREGTSGSKTEDRLDPAQPAGHFREPVGAAADHIEKRAQRRCGRHLRNKEPIRLEVQWTVRIQDERGDRCLNVRAELLRQFPVPQNATPCAPGPHRAMRICRSVSDDPAGH